MYTIGVLSVLFGVYIFMRPGAGAQSIISIIAVWAIVVGALRVFFAFKIKSMATDVAERVTDAGTE